MNPLRIYVAEDEPLARRALVATLRATPGWMVTGSATDGRSALEACLTDPPDVLLTDIRMPLLDGLELVAALREAHAGVVVVFVTAHDQHALAAFRLAAVDYVLKPIADADLARCLSRAREVVNQRNAATKLSGVRDSPDAVHALLTHPPRYVTRIVVRSQGRIDIVPVADVLALRVERNYVDVITPTGTWLHRETLKSLAARLDPAAFVQTSRSVLVATARVRRVEHDRSGARVVLHGGSTFRVSRAHLRNLEAALSLEPGARSPADCDPRPS